MKFINLKKSAPILSSPMRGVGSEPRNNDGVLFAMGQHQSKVGYVRLVLKSRSAWQQVHDRVLRDVLVKRREIGRSPDQGRSPAGSGSDLPCTRCSGFALDSESGRFISKTGKFRCPNRTPDGECGRGL